MAGFELSINGRFWVSTEDVAGNVGEFCQDRWTHTFEPAVGGEAPPDPASCVVRGGTWKSVPKYVRSSSRRGWDRRLADLSFGFRCARDAGVE